MLLQLGMYMYVYEMGLSQRGCVEGRARQGAPGAAGGGGDLRSDNPHPSVPPAPILSTNTSMYIDDLTRRVTATLFASLHVLVCIRWSLSVSLPLVGLPRKFKYGIYSNQ